MAVATSKLSTTLHTIGPYETIEKLGEGGMGAVYKARHSVTGQVVAVKIIHARWAAEPVLLQRFEREFRVTSNLKHPHIVEALDFGMEGAVPYFVMELVDGESLHDCINRQGPLPEEEAVRVTVQVAEALRLAHQQNFIHRDLKPDNILITARGDAKLTDLGLVKCLDTDVNLTQGGNILGTPYYIAPEQFDDARHVDARADIYALGATLYTAVTGEIPFYGRGKATYVTVLKKKLLNEVTPPRKLAPRLSTEVDLIIRRCMRADKEQRFASCDELIQALTGRTQLDAPTRPARPARPLGGGKERRAAIRFQATIDSNCEPLAHLHEKCWKGKTYDISSSGLRLIMPRRFERGTFLAIELEGQHRQAKSTHIIQVIRVKRDGPKSWCLGCAFVQPLTEFELESLVGS